MILPDDTTPIPPEDDEDIPFKSSTTCPQCKTPWIHHDGPTKTCADLQMALSALKAAAVQSFSISQALQRIIERIENPKTPSSTNPSIPDLLSDMDL